MPTDLASVQQCDTEKFATFFHAMLAAGVNFPPAAVEAFFFSSAHSDADIDKTIDAAHEAFKAIA
jgi:glutamate-1-semialdehyde 2,1-aminomutase